MDGKRGLDEKAVGGFIESILAVMIVICGIMLLTTSMAFVSMQMADDEGPERLEDASDGILQRFLAEDQLLLSKTVIDFTELDSYHNHTLDSGLQVAGYRIEIVEITPEITPIFEEKNGSSPPQASDMVSLTIPISVHHSDLDVRASLLTVWVW